MSDTTKRDLELAASLVKRSTRRAALAKESPRWLDQERLKGKASAYAHAAELVLGEPQDTGPEAKP